MLMFSSSVFHLITLIPRLAILKIHSPTLYPYSRVFIKVLRNRVSLSSRVCKIEFGRRNSRQLLMFSSLEDGNMSYFVSDDMLWKTALLPLNSISTASSLVKPF
ncbi:hypothetical protein CEXT_160941 [Caerostris extrusa]|uniref:Uncharacterized protein n=1 Tax=Caerostris extrusa TaxID=172846 RepID=A0AAV4W9I0_CAEEX|nr:hypothetical protein CEXT_160941 [Caerostris extrusa]